MSVSFLIKALDNQNLAEALSIIKSQGFFYSLNSCNLILIKSRVLSPEANKYKPELRLLLLSLIIINNIKLQPKQLKMCVEYLSETLKTSTHKQICAGLLVRLPNFQNKHTVLSHFHPIAIPLNLMLSICPEVKKNKPTALHTQLQRYRQQWVLLLNGFQFKFQKLKEIVDQYKQFKQGTQYELLKNITSEVSYLALRIKNMYNQKINLNDFCQTMQTLIQADSDNKLSQQLSTPICQLLQCSAYRLINEMLLKLQKRFIRKYQWLVRILEYGTKTLAEYPDLTLKILTLINSVQKIFGNGAIHGQSILFTNQNALILLLQSLLLQSDDGQMFNLQNPIVNNHKLKNVSQLSVKKTQNPYPEFVKLISKRQKQDLATIIFQIMISYYREPHDSMHIVKISEILSQHEHKLSHQNKKYSEEIRHLILPKAYVYSPGLQQAYEEIIQGGALDYFAKKRKIDTSIYKQPLKQSYGMKLIQSRRNTQNNLRQTQYFDCFSDPQKVNNINQSQVHQSFYSFKNQEAQKQQSEMFYSAYYKSKVSDHDPLDKPLFLEPTQQMSKYSLIKNVSKKSQQPEKTIEIIESQGRMNNPIEIFDAENELDVEF